MAGLKGKPISLFVYFTLWCLYSLQGPLYPTGSTIAKILLLILLLWSIVVMLKVNMQGRKGPLFLRALNAFLLITTIYGILLLISGQELYITEITYVKTSNSDYLKNIYMSLLPIYVFYYYSIKGGMTDKHVVVFVTTLLLINVLWFFHSRAQAMLLASQSGRDLGGVTLNIGYSFLSLFPLVLLCKKKPLYQYFLVIVILIFIIICMKRGAIIIGAVCFLYFLYSTIVSFKGKRKLIIVLLSIITFTLTISVLYNLWQSNEYFVYRIEQTLEGNSSNRDQLYSTFIKHFISERNFGRFIFGNGANATLKVGMNYAHNDWLELAINNGVIGLLFYLWYYFALLLDYNTFKKAKNIYADVIMMALIIMFASSLFSMSYASLDKGLSIALGFVLAQRYNIKTERAMLKAV